MIKTILIKADGTRANGIPFQNKRELEQHLKTESNQIADIRRYSNDSMDIEYTNGNTIEIRIGA